MPEAAKTLGFVFGLDDFGYIGEAVEPVGKHIILQFTKTTGKVVVLLRRQLLIAEKDHLVVEQGLVDRRDLRIAEFRGQVDIAQFGAEHTGLGQDLH